MNKTHTTKDGSKMLICQMDDSHLKNTINYMIREINKQKANLSASVEITPLKSALYGIKKEDVSGRAHRAIPKMVELMFPYLAEAMLRGMDFSKDLQEMLERSGQETCATSLMLKDSDCDDCLDDHYDEYCLDDCF